ncbi:MAG: alpha-amylase family glycosyl hydrolase [Acidimicrobiia bacterium]|nr:alpha-amylase family glycosyl hydrolase [Acidimicrobiia bacterium]
MNAHDTNADSWWRHGVVYQVYLRSFADGNGDGTGDIAGLRSRLGYLHELGVDALWINPWYSSPLKDGGYDVADYRTIDERFGTMKEVELFIGEAHEFDIKVIADLVPNHTSDQHVWFQEALAASPGDPARDRYVFRPGKGTDGSDPPTNWTAVFGGSAWERVADGDWYLHIFDPSQPDLNWQNEEVRAEFDDVFRFWLDRGIDGFRIDVAHGLVKDLSFPDVVQKAAILESERIVDHPFWDRDGVHEINRRWRAVLDEYDNKMMVAEAWVSADRLPLYLRPDEYHQSFNFDLLDTNWDAVAFAEVIERSVKAADAVGAASTWVLSNHDVMRHSTRYGLPAGTKWRQWPMVGPHEALDQEAGTRRARAAALITLSLPGSTYVYQGEELGLPEVWDLSTDVLEDPTWERSDHSEKGRDGCRVPIPWESDGPSFGFGSGAPWLPQPASFAHLSAAAQANDPTSTLSLYRRATSVRREHLATVDGFSLVDLGPDILAYERGSRVLVVANMGATAIPLPDGELLVSSALDQGDEIAPDSAVWILR